MSFCDSIAHFFLLLNNIPLFGCTTIYLAIHLLRDALVAFKFWQLWVKLLYTFVCRFFCGCLGKYCFSDSSVGKESTCNAGDPGLIPGLGRSPGEGLGYPFQYSWASLVAQLVKNPPAMRETLARSLDWEDPLEKGKATHSSILAWRIPWTV